MKLFIIFTIFLQFTVNSDKLERQKRYIYYPYGGSYKLVIGIGIPLMLPKFQSVTFASNIQFMYPQVTNLSQVQQELPIIVQRKKRELETKSEWLVVYSAVEKIMDKYGLNGKSCLLRSICENAGNSLFHNANGLYGELMHILLTPNYGTKTEHAFMENEYTDARKAGKFGVDCVLQFPNCTLEYGLLDLISYLE